MEKPEHGVFTTTEPIPVVVRPSQFFYFPELSGRPSVSGPSFIRKQKEDAAPCYPVACLAWLLLRDVCDWYDSDFTQEGDVPTNSRSAISIRVLLLFVPILAIVDALLNFGLSILILPLFFLKCCYPFKTKLIDARKAGSPHSCCCLQEACDPVLRVLTSLMLFLCTPLILYGICMPQIVQKKFVYWADGHTSGMIYFDRSSLCCTSQFPCGLFFRNRSVGDVMS